MSHRIEIIHAKFNCVFFRCPAPYGAVNKVLDKLVECCAEGNVENDRSWPEIRLIL